MQKVTIEMENCYGIGKLSCEFDFSQGPVHSVYAPNGFMKTSFANALQDLADGKDSKDRMFPTATTRRVVRDGAGVDLTAEQVLVIPPYEASFPPERGSLLLVDAGLKQQFDDAVAAIEDRKERLLKALKQRSGVTGRNVTPESELTTCFNAPDLLSALDAMVTAAAAADMALGELPYDALFNEKAAAFLQSEASATQIAAYVQQFESLVSQSPILTAKFNHTNAQAVNKSLTDSSFFEAGHWIVLHEQGTPREIRGAKQMKDRVDTELKRVLSDAKLLTAFNALDKKLSGNAELKRLREYLREHPELIARLTDLGGLKREVWAAHLAAEASLLEDLRAQFAASRTVMETVVAAAQAQATDWQAVVALFNSRFSVPFAVKVENQADVILREQTPRLVFEFRGEGQQVTSADHQKLLDVLSQGELRALYLLNVLFEIRVRQRGGAATLIVVDDIADSFDYRNKYAIIEYLLDVSRVATFRLIILTHNFDFHRSAAGRMGVRRANRRLAVRAGSAVDLVEDKYQRSPLTLWRDHPEDAGMFIASVPFVRNLAEYCGRTASFDLLTEVLHLKARTKALTLADLDAEYGHVIAGYSAPQVAPRTSTVWTVIETTAAAIQADGAEHAELESKIVLSIAIRLRAEEHMIAAIADPTFVASITRDQTHQLLARYRTLFPNAAELRVLEQVQLMTPENIHLNSFMYEPILDLGIRHLKRLYADVLAL